MVRVGDNTRDGGIIAHIRTHKELMKLKPTEAEQLLIDHAKAGTVCRLKGGSLPEEGEPDGDKTIRAEVLRYLILGGCDACEVDQKGLRLFGGHISGALDLSFHSIKGALWLRNWRFDKIIEMEQFTCGFLAFSGSSLTGIRAPNLFIRGSLFLPDTIFKASLLLQCAKIGGQLALNRAKFLETKQTAETVWKRI